MAGELLLINPRRRTRRKSTRSRRRVSYARRNPTRRKRSRALAVSVPSRRSPVRRRRRSSGRFRRYASTARRGYSRAVASGFGQFFTQKLVPAGVGAAGALALDMAWPMLPLPDALKGGPLAPAVRIAGAVGIGMVASAVGGKRFGNEAMGGALVVTLYDLAKGFIKTEFPSVAMNGLGAFVPQYSQLGWTSPAQNVGVFEQPAYDYA